MLPAGFQFSQSTLQDYVDCPRRFQLRYILRQAWPGVRTEPLQQHERHMDRGVQFHRLVQRHQLGIPVEQLERGLDEELAGWWRAYLGFDLLHSMPGRRYPEITLSADLSGARLLAKYDLLVVSPNQGITIFDWKTSLKPLRREFLLKRLQTHVYPYILARSGDGLLGTEISPKQITFCCWNTAAPSEPVIIQYSQEQYQQDESYLSGLLAALRAEVERGPAVWILTADEHRCRFCEYRSLCGRGEAAGNFEEMDDFGDEIDPSVADFGLVDVEEIGF
jgi:RecB family exonuclease